MGLFDERQNDLTRDEFEGLALRHLDALYGVAVRLTRNERDAEDLVQDALLKAYRFFDRFERGSNIKAWLFKIMTNIFINNYRHKGRQPVGVSYDDIDDNFLYHQVTSSTLQAADPEQILFNKLVDSDVRKAIDELPEDFRIV